MHHRIDTVLKRLRQDLAPHLDPESIHAACRHAGHTWRDASSTPSPILHWFVIQVLHGNTALTTSRCAGGGSSPTRPTARPAPLCPWPSSRPCSATWSRP